MNKLLKSALSLSMALALMFSLGTAAFAERYFIEDGDITVTADTSSQTVSQGGQDYVQTTETVITSNGTTSAESPSSNTVTINAEAGATANVTLSGVNIDTSKGDSAAITVNAGDNSSVNIELDGNNTVQSATNHAGVEKSGSGKLTIKDETKAENGIDASLTATGGSNGAGIGGAVNSSGENIEIKSGNISATGGAQAAGIGGGSIGSGENITISGGTIAATGGTHENGTGDAAGIGGGSSGSGKNIKITNANVTANGSINGAGIGGGNGGSGEDITIENSTVKATGGNGAAGIGGGSGGSGAGHGNNINIIDSKVEAFGGGGAAGIGGGLRGDGTDIHITGGKVKATGGRYESNNGILGGAGIGGGASSPNIDIDGEGEFIVKGPAEDGHADNITISNAKVEATGGYGAAGIGGGATALPAGENTYSFGGKCTTITISGNANVTAQGGEAYTKGGDTMLASGTAIGNGSTSTATGDAAALDISGLYDTGKVVLKNADDETLNTIEGTVPAPKLPTPTPTPTVATLASADTTAPESSPLPVRYYVVTGAEQTWLAGSDDGLEFTLNSDSVNVVKVLIDGEEVEFEINDNGDIVISAEVLQALESGAHEIEFVFPDGSCKANFTVK